MALLAGCASEAPGPGPASEAPEGGGPAPALAGALHADASDRHDWFVDRAEAAGLDFVHFNGMSGEFYFPEMIPAGVGLLDYDNDGDLDPYFVQGANAGRRQDVERRAVPARGPVPLKGRLYRNDLQVEADGTRTLRFTDVTDESGLDARGVGMGVATGDIDNDGWVDLYLTFVGPNRLFRNNGDGTFTDVSASSGTDDPGWGVSASFVDYDRDGWLDLYVGNYVQYDFNTDQKCAVLSSRRTHCGPESYRRRQTACGATRGAGRSPT